MLLPPHPTREREASSRHDPRMSESNQTLTIRMSARTWGTMDSEMDNAGSLSRGEANQDRSELADAIRHEGWRQLPTGDGEWPPMEQEIDLTFPRAWWAFILSELIAGIAVYEVLEDEESIALGRSAVRTLHAAGVRAAQGPPAR